MDGGFLVENEEGGHPGREWYELKKQRFMALPRPCFLINCLYWAFRSGLSWRPEVSGTLLWTLLALEKSSKMVACHWIPQPYLFLSMKPVPRWTLNNIMICIWNFQLHFYFSLICFRSSLSSLRTKACVDFSVKRHCLTLCYWSSSSWSGEYCQQPPPSKWPKTC